MNNQATKWASIKCVYCPREIRGYYGPIFRLFDDMKEDGWILEDDGEGHQINAMCPECGILDGRG